MADIRVIGDRMKKAVSVCMPMHAWDTQHTDVGQEIMMHFDHQGRHPVLLRLYWFACIKTHKFSASSLSELQRPLMIAHDINSNRNNVLLSNATQHDMI